MLNPGDRIGDWEIVLPLGQGGMGSVYRCRHALSHRIEAAVKVLRPSDMSSARERFIREAEALHALSHPAIVRVHGFGQDAASGTLWMAMELVGGDNFEHLLADEAFPRDRVADIFGPVAEGLAYAHSRGIVHRDIKPANLMLRQDGRSVLLDFGIAVQEGHERLTQEGVVPGTVAYAAPEQVTFGRDDDPALADIYALGQVLCECLTGRPTFPRPTGVSAQRRAVQILKKKLKMAPLDPGPGVADRLRDLVIQATQPDPNRRGPPLAQWPAVLHGGPPGPVEVTELHAAFAPPADLDADADAGPSAGLEHDDVDLDGPSVELVGPGALPRDLALPVTDDDPVDDLHTAETEVRSRSAGAWRIVVGAGAAVVVVGLLGVVLVAAAGGAAWWSLGSATAPEPASERRLGDVLSPGSDTKAPPDEVVTTRPDVPAPDLQPAEVSVAERPAAVRPESTPSATGSGDARLVVAADRAAKVYLDGALLRLTPVTRRLDAGDYEVRLVAGDGLDKRFVVHLESGETARRIWDFGDGEWRSFDGGLDEASLPTRPNTTGLEDRVRGLPAVKSCLTQAPQPWTVTLRFVVVPDGSIAADAIEPESLVGQPVERCLFDAVRALDLGPSQAGAAVRVRLPAG